MHLIAPYTVSLCNDECLWASKYACVSEREREREGEKEICPTENEVCTCAWQCQRDQPNKLHGCSHSATLTTPETKGDVESSFKDRWKQEREVLNDCQCSCIAPFPSLHHKPPLPHRFFFFLSPSSSPPSVSHRFFHSHISKVQRERGEKSRKQRRQSYNSTYKHTGIIIRRPRRCHDNTQGGEGGMWWHRGRGGGGRRRQSRWQ